MAQPHAQHASTMRSEARTLHTSFPTNVLAWTSKAPVREPTYTPPPDCALLPATVTFFSISCVRSAATAPPDAAEQRKCVKGLASSRPVHGRQAVLWQRTGRCAARQHPMATSHTGPCPASQRSCRTC